MLTRDELKKKIGDMGEDAVREAFEALGSKVSMSEDYYDSVKDMAVTNDYGSNFVEVKTELPKAWFRHPHYDGFTEMFTIGVNQKTKCSEVDILMFVQIPYHQDECIKLYTAPHKDKRKFVKTNNTNGTNTIGIPIRECRLFATINDKDKANKLRDLSIQINGDSKFYNAPPHVYPAEV